jgi:predicted molibdopterin-dependent oxidoreductase YjgC
VSKVLTTCGFCGCGCGVFLEVDGGRIVGVAPEKAHPVSRGTLCFKGWNGFRALNHPDRLTQPLARKNGTFSPVTWDEALSRVAEGLSTIAQKYGANAVGVVGSTKLTNEEAYLLSRLARACLGTNHLDTAARLTHGPTLSVLPKVWGHLGRTARILDIRTSDLIFLLGEDPKDQMARVGAYVLRAAKDGIPLVVVDPRRSDLASFATVHLQVQPGTDTLLLLAVLREIIARGLHSSEPAGFTELKTLAEPFTLERATAECRVAAEDVRRVADLLAGSKRPIILFGAGLTGHVNGSAAVALLYDLRLLLGEASGAWPGLLPLHHSCNERGVCDLGVLPDYLPGYRPVGDAAAQLAFAKEWSAALPSVHGKTLGEMIEAAAKGELKALYVIGENVLRLWPNSAAVRNALERLEFLAVQDLFLTETAQLAHVVLPAAGYAEKEGTFTNLEGRVQAVRKAVDPPGEARPDLKIFVDLMSRLGHPLVGAGAAEVFQEITRLVPGYGKLSWDGVSQPGGGWVEPEQGEPWNELLVPQLRESPEKPDGEFPFLGFVGSPPFHWRTGTMVERSHTLAREYPEPEVWANAQDAREMGLRPGTPVRVVTRRGSIQRTLRVTNDVPRGTLFVPMHYRNGLTNEILADDLEPESKVPAMRCFAGKLEKVG